MADRPPIQMLLRTSDENGRFKSVINVLFALSCLFLVAVLVAAMAMGSVKADQIGALVNNLTGTLTVVPPGTCFYNSIFSDLHVIDRSQQSIEMKRTHRRGVPDDAEDGSDEVGAVKIKTIDGSDVSCDIIINYSVDPERVMDVIRESGLGEAYKEKWVMDFARSICRNTLGEMTTEEFYDSRKRDERAALSQVALNKSLNPWGIRVTAVQVQDFGFYHEYEEKIKEKKLADQEVEEQKSQAKAASERQKRIRIEEESKVTVEVAQFKGEMEKRSVEAEAQASKIRTEADAYTYSTKVGADARFFQNERQSQGILATRTADADGLRQLVNAMEGGRNLVLLEYAQKMKSMKLTGQPILLDSRMERIQHFGLGASSVPAASGGVPEQGVAK